MENFMSNLDLIPGVPVKNEIKSLQKCISISLIFFSYVVGYTYLSKFVKAYFIHESVPRINKERIIRGLWRLIFSAWVMLLFWKRTWRLRPKDYSFLQVVTIPQCNFSTFQSTNKADIVWENALVTAPAVYFVHQLYISLRDSAEPAIATMSGLAIFFISANSLNCYWLSLQVLFFLALNVGSMELAKIFYAMKSRYRGYSGPSAPTFFRICSPPIFAIHVISWALINFYLFPSFFLSLPSITEVAPEYRLATMYVNVFLIFFAKQQFFCSPQWSLLKLLVRRSTGPVRTINIQSIPSFVLLPYSSTLISELRTIQLTYLCEAPPTSAERRKLRRKMLSSGKQTETIAVPESKKFSSNQLLSTVKCLSVLKRKMRCRYEKKDASEASCDESLSGMETQSSERESSGEASTSASETDEIFDIFIPVPTNSFNAEGVSETGELSQASLAVTADMHSVATNEKKRVSNSEEPPSADTIAIDDQHEIPSTESNSEIKEESGDPKTD